LVFVLQLFDVWKWTLGFVFVAQILELGKLDVLLELTLIRDAPILVMVAVIFVLVI
jgi:hypothetical protein